MKNSLCGSRMMWRGVLTGVVLTGGGFLVSPAASAFGGAWGGCGANTGGFSTSAVTPLATAGGTSDTPSAYEGKPVTFKVKVSFSELLLAAVRYKFKTEDDSAVAGKDYRSRTGTVALSRRGGQKSITVNTIKDSVTEGTETFKLVLYDREVASYLGSWSKSPRHIAGTPRRQELTGEILDFAQSSTTSPSLGGRIGGSGNC